MRAAELLARVRAMDDGELLFFLGCLCPRGSLDSLRDAVEATGRIMGGSGAQGTREAGMRP